jgi:hypothetical protein
MYGLAHGVTEAEVATFGVELDEGVPGWPA